MFIIVVKLSNTAAVNRAGLVLCITFSKLAQLFVLVFAEKREKSFKLSCWLTHNFVSFTKLLFWQDQFSNKVSNFLAYNRVSRVGMIKKELI